MRERERERSDIELGVECFFSPLFKLGYTHATHVPSLSLYHTYRPCDEFHTLINKYHTHFVVRPSKFSHLYNNNSKQNNK
jgi:hypothetical protein